MKNAIRLCNIIGGSLNVAAAWVETAEPPARTITRQGVTIPEPDPVSQLLEVGLRFAAQWLERV